jgi:hypothetical protein
MLLSMIRILGGNTDPDPDTVAFFLSKKSLIPTIQNAYVSSYLAVEPIINKNLNVKIKFQCDRQSLDRIRTWIHMDPTGLVPWIRIHIKIKCRN